MAWLRSLDCDEQSLRLILAEKYTKADLVELVSREELVNIGVKSVSLPFSLTNDACLQRRRRLSHLEGSAWRARQRGGRRAAALRPSSLSGRLLRGLPFESRR